MAGERAGERGWLHSGREVGGLISLETLLYEGRADWLEDWLAADVSSNLWILSVGLAEWMNSSCSSLTRARYVWLTEGVMRTEQAMGTIHILLSHLPPLNY